MISSRKQSGDPVGLQNDQSDTASRGESETLIQRACCKEVSQSTNEHLSVSNYGSH